jgi:hypothetical protein
MNLSDLHGAEYNADIRHISDASKSGLAVSIAEFGDISGITFNTLTNRLVTGHQRVDRLKAQYGDLAIEDGAIRTPDGHVFPVRFVEWGEYKERLANVVANSPEIAGTFTAKLPEFIGELPATGKAELRVQELAASIKLSADFVENSLQGDKINDNTHGIDDQAPQLPPDFGADIGHRRDDRDGWPVYFMLSHEDYQRFKQVSGKDAEAWFLMVLDYAEAGKFKG